ncbi:MAG: NAD(+)/NADH kinase [Syntrophobacteraceae bacterium]|nr:NAD(+)/NADH kinase [Syntrophobacteraceae bacterium]
MQEIFIVYKHSRPEASELALRIKDWLEKRRILVHCAENIDDPNAAPVSDKLKIPKTAGLVIVLGGDGTFLSVARLIETLPTPIVGINLGGLGFLTEITVESCFNQLEKILDGQCEIEERMRLRVSIRRDNREIFRQRVLNDAVINKGALARIIDLKTSIDGHFLTHYRGDGLIISTPTGSTAYNISAGGPIVFPTAKALIVTPICSFTLTNRPIIFPPNITIQVELAEPTRDVTLTCDGQVGCLLTPSDIIIITAAANPLRLIKTPAIDYFEILRTKLRWGQN